MLSPLAPPSPTMCALPHALAPPSPTKSVRPAALPCSAPYPTILFDTR